MEHLCALVHLIHHALRTLKPSDNQSWWKQWVPPVHPLLRVNRVNPVYLVRICFTLSLRLLLCWRNMLLFWEVQQCQSCHYAIAVPWMQTHFNQRMLIHSNSSPHSHPVHYSSSLNYLSHLCFDSICEAPGVKLPAVLIPGRSYNTYNLEKRLLIYMWRAMEKTLFMLHHIPSRHTVLLFYTWLFVLKI